MADVGHFAYPFKWGPHGNVVELEQDTLDEIVNCVEVIVRCDVGALQDQPDFGVDDPTFTHSRNTDLLARQINNWEPRAQVTLSVDIDRFDKLMEVVTLDVSTRS